QKAKEKATKSGQATGKTKVPKWSQPNYTNQTSQEEQADLEQQKRALLEKLNQGGE
ncbi:MAG: DNA helicase, partial [Streptococcus sp.]